MRVALGTMVVVYLLSLRAFHDDVGRLEKPGPFFFLLIFYAYAWLMLADSVIARVAAA